MITPFRTDGQIDHETAWRLSRYLVDRGSDGLVIAGTTGESPTLTDQEKLALVATVVKSVGTRATIIAGTGTYHTSHSVELTKAVAELGADAVLAVTPYYNKPTQSGLIAHFTRIAEASPLAVMLYDIPSRTAQSIDLGTLQVLADHPQIAAVKDATMDMDHTSALVNITKTKSFEVYSGQDSYTLPMLAVGAVGVVSVISHLAGPQVRKMVRAVLDEHDYQTALQIHQQLLPLCQACFIETNPGPVKAAMDKWWDRVGEPRLPLQKARTETLEQIRTTMEVLDR